MKDKKKLIILIAIAVLVIAGIIVAVIFIPKKNKPTDKTTTTTTATIADEITIKFDTKDGEKIEDMKVKKGEKVTLPSANKEGYTFDKWVDDKNTEYTTEATFENDVTLTAKYTEIKADAKTVKVTYDSKGGSKVSATTYECKDDSITIKLPKAPTKDGYNFVSWADKNGKVILTGAKLTCENITLYANWEAKKTEEVKNTEEVKKTEEVKPAEKKPTCPEGFTLNESTKKCTSQKNPEYYCNDGYKNSTVDNTVCYKYVKSPDKVTCKDGRYHYEQSSTGGGTMHFCATELASYTGAKTQCEGAGGHLLSNNHCVKNAEPVSNGSLKFECYSSTFREGSALASGEKDGCYDLKQRTYGCKNAGEGYSMNYTYGKCVKTVDAELK
jgi:uncharacterized repeat protein (TIGR02543 family)